MDDHTFTVPVDIIEIPRNYLRGNNVLKKVIIHNKVQRIEKYAFYECENLVNLEFEPESVLTYIGYGAFSGCIRLETLCLPNSITYMENCAFYKCVRLKTVNIPNRLTELNQTVFFRCNQLQKIDLPSSIRNLHLGCFEFCTSLEEIIIPSSVKNVYKTAFHGCSNLKKIIIFGTPVFEENPFPDSYDPVTPIHFYMNHVCYNMLSLDIKYKYGIHYKFNENIHLLDKEDGYHCVKYPDGSVYEGHWMGSKKHGYGVMKTGDHSVVHDGLWVFGIPKYYLDYSLDQYILLRNNLNNIYLVKDMDDYLMKINCELLEYGVGEETSWIFTLTDGKKYDQSDLLRIYNESPNKNDIVSPSTGKAFQYIDHQIIYHIVNHDKIKAWVQKTKEVQPELFDYEEKRPDIPYRKRNRVLSFVRGFQGFFEKKWRVRSFLK